MMVAGVVLAAGSAIRFGMPKQLATLPGGLTMVSHAVTRLVDAGCPRVYLVVGSHADEVQQAVAHLDVRVVHNEEWEEGLASSLRAAVSAARSDAERIDALLFMTCDMPMVSSEHIRTLVDAFVRGAPRVASHYAETLGIPAVIGATEWSEIEQLRGDRGAKQLLSRVDTVSVALSGGDLDVDTRADYERYRRGAM